MAHFSVEQLKSIKTVITHGNCPDGIASAMIVADAYAGTDIAMPAIREISHGSPEKADLEPAPGMMFVDFSPDPARAQDFIAAGALCLDHHAKGSSVQDFVKAGLGVFGDENDNPGVCGAVLAYEHVWKPLRAEHQIDHEVIESFARLSGIRDTWQRQSPDWLKACELAEALRFWSWEKLRGVPPAEWAGYFDQLGRHVWEKKTKTVAKVSERVYRWTSPRGTRAGFFQGTKLSSDVAEAIGGSLDVLIAYDIRYEEGKFELSCSSRSRGSYDCGSLALAHGGGGHTRAAGFTLPMTLESPNPYRMLQDMLTAYEDKMNEAEGTTPYTVFPDGQILSPAPVP